MSAEYRVDLRVRNNWLLRRMEQKGLHTGTDLARAAGISVVAACKYIALQSPPLCQDGTPKSSAIKVCKTLGSDIGELWPADHLYVPMDRNRASLELSKTDISALIGHDYEPSAETRFIEYEPVVRSIEFILSTLPTREREVVCRHYGLDGCEPETLEQIAKSLKLTRERIRQIERRALERAHEKMRHRQMPLIKALGFMRCAA